MAERRFSENFGNFKFFREHRQKTGVEWIRLKIKDLVALTYKLLKDAPSELEIQVLMTWTIQKIPTALTLLSPYTVLSRLPWLSSMVSQLRICSLFEQNVNKFVNFCSQYRENFSNTVILLVSLNIILWH